MPVSDFIHCSVSVLYLLMLQLRLFTCSQYVSICQVSLRYQLLFYASRSMILDVVAIANPHNSVAGGGSGAVAAGGVALPLYRRGIEKERFDIAVHWLRCDIEQLLLSRGLVFSPKQGILFNVQQLFSCDVCASLAT